MDTLDCYIKYSGLSKIKLKAKKDSGLQGGLVPRHTSLLARVTYCHAPMTYMLRAPNEGGRPTCFGSDLYICLTFQLIYG